MVKLALTWINGYSGPLANVKLCSPDRKRQEMTSLDERENAFEAEFAHREELRFKVRERALRSLAEWAAQQLGKTGQASEAYAREIVALDVASPKPETAPEQIEKDLRATGIGREEIGRRMSQFLALAEAAICGR